MRDKDSGKEEKVPLSNLDNRSTASVLKSIHGLARQSAIATERSSTFLHKGLVLALDLHWKAERSPAVREEIAALMAESDIRRRKDANPFTSLAKLCFPGRKSSDYHRYAGALRWAANTELPAAEFGRALKESGMSELAKRDRASDDKDRKPNADRIGREARDVLRDQPPLASFNLAAKKGAPRKGVLLMIGERFEDGEVRVFEVLDDAADRQLARRIFGRLGRQRLKES